MEAEAGTVWEGYALLSHLRDLGPGAVVALDVRFNLKPREPGQRRRKRRTREPEALYPQARESQDVQWVAFFDHGTSTDAGPRGSAGLIRQLERKSIGRYFDALAEELGHDDLETAHRFRVYLLGYRGDEGIWPST